MSEVKGDAGSSPMKNRELPAGRDYFTGGKQHEQK